MMPWVVYINWDSHPGSEDGLPNLLTWESKVQNKTGEEESERAWGEGAE
jgi:hypothetical protein